MDSDQSLMFKLLTPSYDRPCSPSRILRNHRFSESLALHGPWRNHTIFEETAKLKREERHLELQTQKIEALGESIERDLDDIRKMQAAVRRKQKRLAKFLLHTASAIIIQAVWRGHLGRRKAWRRQEERAFQAIFVFWKFHHLRLLKKTAATRIQALFRGHLARSAWYRLRTTIRLQSITRGWLARREAHHRIALKEATPALVHCYIKAGCNRIMANIVRPNHAASCIQNAWKLYMRRRTAKQRRITRIKHQMRKKGIEYDETAWLSDASEEACDAFNPTRRSRTGGSENPKIRMAKRPVLSRHRSSSTNTPHRRRQLRTPVLESDPRKFTPTPKKHTTIWVKLQNQEMQDPVTLKEAVDELLENKRNRTKKKKGETIDILKTLKPVGGSKGSQTPSPAKDSTHKEKAFFNYNTPATSHRRDFKNGGRRSRLAAKTSARQGFDASRSSPDSHSSSHEGGLLYEHVPEHLKGSGKRFALRSGDKLPLVKNTSLNAKDPNISGKRGSWSMLDRKPLFCSNTLANGVFLEGSNRPEPRPPSGPYSSRCFHHHSTSDELISNKGARYCRTPSPRGETVMFDFERVEQQIGLAHAPASSPKMHSHYIMKEKHSPRHQEASSMKKPPRYHTKDPSVAMKTPNNKKQAGLSAPKSRFASSLDPANIFFADLDDSSSDEYCLH